MKISPIFYMGNKKKLIKKGLIELFPKDIDCMFELFGGSAIVSMNTNANKYFIYDISPHLIELYKLFKEHTEDEIINHVNSRIEEYKLPKIRTRRNMLIGREKEIEEYKKSYMKFREYYNTHKNTLDFYTLMFFSFSQQFRFNNNGKFNMPFGNDCFTETNEQYIRNGCKFFNNENVQIIKDDFRNFNIDLLSDKDFVYLDPPYFNTTATYNENDGWNEQDENDLYKLCEELHKKNVKFGLSNVFSNKGILNQKIIDWCELHDWNVYTFNSMTYCACGKGNSNAKEVYICNY